MWLFVLSSMYYISKINIRNLSKEIACRNLSKELRSTRNILIISKYFEIFQNISKSKLFRKISKEISKYFEIYCEILRNRANKNNATPYLIIPSRVAGGNILHIIALFRNISQNFKFFFKKINKRYTYSHNHAFANF